MPTKYDYTDLRTQFLTADPELSIRALCLVNGIDASKVSSIQRMAIKEDWAALREKRLVRTEERVIDQLAMKLAARRLRRVEVEDNALELIDESLNKMRADMDRTKKEQDPETHEWIEIPAQAYRPDQIVQLIDRIKGLFDGNILPENAAASGAPPSLTQINFGDFDGANAEHRALAAAVVSATRGAGESARRTPGSSPLPDAPGAGPDE
jgi:hypothetical protein